MWAVEGVVVRPGEGGWSANENILPTAPTSDGPFHPVDEYKILELGGEVINPWGGYFTEWGEARDGGGELDKSLMD